MPPLSCDYPNMEERYSSSLGGQIAILWSFNTKILKSLVLDTYVSASRTKVEESVRCEFLSIYKGK